MSVRAIVLPRTHGPARALWLLLGAAFVCTLVFALALACGSNPIPWADLPRLLFAPDGSVEADIVHRLRLPRAVAAATTGALLSMAGALMQVLVRNPLADPYVLGLSGGAALGALSAIALGTAAWTVNLGAFVGALVATFAVFGLAGPDLGRVERVSAADPSARLLLTGVMLSALAMAGVSLILSVAPVERLRSMVFWMLGDLSGAVASVPALAAVPLLALLALPFGRELNLLLRGPGPALLLGVDVRRLRLLIYAAASLAAALSVNTAGTIGFVGLVVPHALRLLIGNDQRVLVPASGLAGAAFLLAADTVARTLLAPQQLPVGVVTAMVGAPIFLWLLSRRSVTR
jgi:iron complex transport system permease protein